MKSLNELKKYAVARNFPGPTSLKRVLGRMGYVQADPIRSPARAQDLILHQRVKNYRAGDLERIYAKLDVEEDFLINYGYVTKTLHHLMHPRSNSEADDSWPTAKRKQAALLLAFVKEKGTVHPKEVDDYFSHGKVTNYWGGSSNATTHLLDEMHYLGMIRVTRREKGIRLYSARESNHSINGDQQTHLDRLADVVINLYAPLPGASLSYYLRRLRYAVPQWKSEIPAVVQNAKSRLDHARVQGIDWYWPRGERPRVADTERVRLLAPFDPLVHDRTRFELLWSWVYRFEAYTPAPKRKLGYYAMPILWRNDVIGWANLSIKDAELGVDIGYAGTPPRDRIFKRELEAELERMRFFLRLTLTPLNLEKS
jgi:uncharacterized protein YcaQ